jgi:hypothetical protein
MRPYFSVCAGLSWLLVAGAARPAHAASPAESGEAPRAPSSDASPATPAPAPALLAVPSPARRASKAVVHIDADSGVRLEARTVSGNWTSVCTAPCDEPVPLRWRYRIVGEHTSASSPFRLEGSPGDRLGLELAGGSKAMYAGGIALDAVGGVALIVGIAAIIVEATGFNGPCVEYDSLMMTCDEYAPGHSSGVGVAAGVGVSIAGLAMFVGGTMMIAKGMRTQVTQTVGSASSPPPSAPRASHWLRAPEWSDLAQLPHVPSNATTFPLFSRSF